MATSYIKQLLNENDALKEKIELMKCCGNCKHQWESDIFKGSCAECVLNSNWQEKE